MQKMAILFFLYLAMVAVVLPRTNAHQLTASMKHATVMKGEQFEFLCNASKEIESCSIHFVNLEQSFKVRDTAAKMEKYEYFGKGFSKGDCGIRYFNTTADMQGTVTCKVAFADDDQEIYESIDLKVGLPITLVELSANNEHFEFIENDELIFKCSAVGADPLPNLSVFIGGKEIMSSSTNKESVVVRKIATIQDNNAPVFCKAEQSTLNLSKNTSTSLVVKYKPRLDLDHAINFGDGRHESTNITARILANPLPFSMDWYLNGNLVKPHSERYKVHNTSSKSEMWIISTLEIYNLTKEDLLANIAIFVENEIGFLNHTFRTGEIHAEENNETVHFKINLAKNDTNEPIYDIDNKAKDEDILDLISGTNWIVFCVIAILGGIICVIAAFAIFNMDSHEQVNNEEGPSSFQYLSALDQKESATKS